MSVSVSSRSPIWKTKRQKAQSHFDLGAFGSSTRCGGLSVNLPLKLNVNARISIALVYL